MPTAETKMMADYKAKMYETFQKLGTKPEEWVWDQQDPKEARGINGRPAGDCRLCGKHPIVYLFTIVNISKGLRLIVGSECVSNFVEAAPYSAQRKAKDIMQRLTLLNKMTNHIKEQKPISYETARTQADEMSTREIKNFFARIQKERNIKKLGLRAMALDKLVRENWGKLNYQTWEYLGGRRSILSSLQYLKDTWVRGEEKPYMEPAMDKALAVFGLSLPPKPKLSELEEAQ